MYGQILIDYSFFPPNFHFKGDAEGDGAADESFGSVGADDGKAGAGGGKLTLKLLLDHGLIEVEDFLL